MTGTLPNTEDDVNRGSMDSVFVSPTVVDERTGARWVHKDLVQVRKDWETETHVSPPKAREDFGDVESWVEYVQRFGEGSHLLTWNSAGLRAVLDYHADDEHAGRLQWTAHHPFTPSPEWKAWMTLCTGHAVAQREAIERLEDMAADISDPLPAELMNLLRSLRASVNKSAETELRPDGSTSVRFADDKNVAARGGTADLPPEFSITIPLLKGHPVRYRLAVRLRATVTDQARLALRFSIPLAEQALELVYADRVQAARALLGDGFTVLRAAG